MLQALTAVFDVVVAKFQRAVSGADGSSSVPGDIDADARTHFGLCALSVDEARVYFGVRCDGCLVRLLKHIFVVAHTAFDM